MNTLKTKTAIGEENNSKSATAITVSNATMRVIKRVNYCNISNGETKEILQIKIDFTDMEQAKTVQIPYSDISRNKTFNFFEEQGLIFSESEKKLFKNQVLQQRRLAPEYTVLKLPQGYSEYGGARYWALGKHIFKCNSNEIFTMPDENAPVLRESPDGSYRKALDFLNIDNDVSPMLFLSIGFSVWDGMLAQAGYPQRAVLYIVGMSGSGKSTLAREVTKIFKEKTELTLSSTYSALQSQMQRYRAIPILLDDYNESEFKTAKREKGHKLSEFIPIYADREELCKTEHRSVLHLSINGGLIVTAEQPFNNPSTMNRCLAVTPHEFNWDALSEFQETNRKDAVFVDLLKKMILYTMQKYDWIIENIPNWHHKICENGKGYDEYANTIGYRRIMASYRVYMLVIRLWKSFFDSHSINASHILTKMQRALESSVEYTMSLSGTDEPNKIICSAVQKSIALACKKGVISWDKKDLKKDRCKGWFASSNQVYIRGDLLQELVSIKLKKEVSKKLISDALYSDMLISKYKGRYSKSIPQSESNMRYYCINYKKLCEKCNPNNDTSSIFC